MRLLPSAVAALLMLVALAGCGQKGPLYLPGNEEAAAKYDRSSQNDDAQADEDTGEGGRDDGDHDDTQSTPAGEG